MIPSSHRRGPAVLALGFRPFFLLAGLWALIALPLWLAVLRGWLPPPGHYPGTSWHAHALLFGYGLAVVAGFLLTAVRNWTGIQTPTGWPLAGLVSLWLAARLLALIGAPGWLVAAADITFPLALAVSLWRPLWYGSNPMNRVFLPLLAGMSGAALLVHLDALGLLPGAAAVGDRLMLGLIIGLLLLVAGRVLPFFTRSAVAGAEPVTRPWVEQLTAGLWGLWVLAQSLDAGLYIGLTALPLAAVQVLRLAGWHRPGVWPITILAVLYAGYLWLILGLVLSGLAGLGLVVPFAAMHALTVGAIGVFTIGMMSRITLGHTGRAMGASRPMVLAFWSINLAALVRVSGPILWPGGRDEWLLYSGVFWTLAFALFLWVHASMLWLPRADGRPG